MKVIRTDASGREILQGSEEWKQLRVGLLTGTGICDVMPGKRGGYLDSRNTQMMEIATEIFTGKPAGGGFKSTKYMKDGVEREPYARMFVEEKFGIVFEEVAFVQHDWMKVGVSPDGMAVGEPTLIEIKCPKDTTHLGYWMADTVPDEYFWQVHTQIWLCEAQRTLFCSYHPDFKDEGMQLRVIEVKRDEAVCQRIEAEVSKFLAETNLMVKRIREIAAQRAASTTTQPEGQ